MSRNNSCTTYDLSCILAENRFCYLLYNGKYISYRIYIKKHTTLRRVKKPTFCEMSELMIYNLY